MGIPENLQNGAVWLYHSGVAANANPQQKAHVAIDVDIEDGHWDKYGYPTHWILCFPSIGIIVESHPEQETNTLENIRHHYVPGENDSGLTLGPPEIKEDQAIGQEADESQE